MLQFFIIDEDIYDCEGFCIGYLNQDDAHGGGVGSTNDKTLGIAYLRSGNRSNKPASDAAQTPRSVIKPETNLAGVTSNP